MKLKQGRLLRLVRLALAAGVVSCIPVGARSQGGGSHSGFTRSDVGLTVDATDRAQVVSAYNAVYLPALAVPAEWTGAVSGCIPGATSPAYEQATLDMINYFRAMAGMPGNVVLDPVLNAKCQAAALIFLAQNAFSHDPPTTWACYTEEGHTAAASSNIGLGRGGADAIDRDPYMRDTGSANTVLGHRRWILYPPQVTMGTGSTDNGTKASNALWVVAPFGPYPTPAKPTAWPPAVEGANSYVPYKLAYARWSFSHPDTDFTQSVVTMTHDGSPVALTTLNTRDFRYGDPGTGWEPQGITAAAGMQDTTYEVLIENVIMFGAQPRSFSYSVTVFDPEVVGTGSPTPTQTASPTPTASPTATASPTPTPSPTAIQVPPTDIIDFLLGRSAGSTGLDLTLDGVTDGADLLRALLQ